MATRILNTFKNKLAYGQIGESKIAVWLRAQGRYVLPAYEKEIDNNKGPHLFCPTGELVVPDMLVINGLKVAWIEAKHKSVFSFYRKKGQWETGINLRHYGQYLQVAQVISWPIWILFLHEKDRDLSRPGEPWPCPTGLFGQSIEILKTRVSHTSDRWANGMIYWAHKDLKELASLKEVNQVYSEFRQQALIAV